MDAITRRGLCYCTYESISSEWALILCGKSGSGNVLILCAIGIKTIIMQKLVTGLEIRKWSIN